MKIEPSGVILTGICDIRTALCQALTPAPITAVWVFPGRTQVNVCRACLEEQIRDGAWEVPGARVHRRFDAAVYAANGELALTVEVKSHVPSHPEEVTRWAVGIHRNLVAHAGMAPAAYFLLVGYPSHLHLWSRRTSHDLYAMPEYSYHGVDIFSSFLNAATESNTRVELQHERAVVAWLEYLTTMKELPALPYAEWLEESGLFAAIRGGTVARQVPIAA